MPSPSWERRNQRARAAGYKSYYDYRIHGYGLDKPGTTIPREVRNIRRGHRSFKDFERAIKSGNVNTVIPTISNRNATGQYTDITFAVTFDSGQINSYSLDMGQLDRDYRDYWDDLADWFDEYDVEFMPSYGVAEAA